VFVSSSVRPTSLINFWAIRVRAVTFLFLLSVLLAAGRHVVVCALRMCFRLTSTTNPSSCLVHTAARVSVTCPIHFAKREVDKKTNSRTNNLEINYTTSSCVIRNQNCALYQRLYLRKMVARFDSLHTARQTLFDLQSMISNTHI